MDQLNIFDGSNWMASVTIVGQRALIHANSSREWNNVNRWIEQGFYRLDEKTDEYVKIGPCDPEFLVRLAEKAHQFDFSTEKTVV